MLRFIVVDDNIADLNGISEILDWETIGFELVGRAADGHEGLELALKVKPDMVITDVSMPVLSGLDMIKEIKKTLPETKFIVMSCFDDFEFVQKAIEEQALYYILKPIDVDELLKAVLTVKDVRELAIKREMKEYSIKQQIKRDIAGLREYFMINLVNGHTGDIDEMRGRMKYLGIEEKPYRVVYISVSGDTGDAVYVNEFKVRKIFNETVLSKMKGIIFFCEKAMAAVVFGPDSKLNDLITEFFGQISEETCGINIAISNTEESFAKICERFESVKQLAGMTDEKYSGILYEEENGDSSMLSEFSIGTLYSEISGFFRKDDKNLIDEFADKYLGSVGYSADYARSFCFSAVSIVYTLLADENEDFGKIFGNRDEIWQKISSFNFNFDIKQWLVNILTGINNYLIEDNKNKYMQIIEDIKQIVKKSGGKDVTIRSIAEKIQMSSGYINKIFKQYTAQTINEYILDCRMAEAKRRLADPYVKVYEVAEKVGYESTAYFTAVFKQFYGMTPNEYRTSQKGD